MKPPRVQRTSSEPSPEWIRAAPGPEPGTSGEQEQAIRDILYLYVDLTDYCGIGGDNSLGSFDPWRWLQCEPKYGDVRPRSSFRDPR